MYQDKTSYLKVDRNKRMLLLIPNNSTCTLQLISLYFLDKGYFKITFPIRGIILEIKAMLQIGKIYTMKFSNFGLDCQNFDV